MLLGYGWVGQHVNKYFTNAEKYSPDFGLQDPNGLTLALPSEAPDKYNDIVKTKGCVWDVAFIGVPTPMNEDGTCDNSIVEECVKQWERWVKLFVIRSTVTPGTTEYLAKKYGVLICMQPEYIGETLGHPLLGPARDPFIIVGGAPKATKLAAEYWSLVLHANCRIRQVTAKTAELCKYMENSFLATKVLFCNSFFKLAEAVGVDYSVLREAWLDDARIGRSHTLVYEGNPGFSGKCLPKDVNSIVNYARNVAGAPLEMMEQILKINAKMRTQIKSEVPLLPNDEEVSKWSV